MNKLNLNGPKDANTGFRWIMGFVIASFALIVIYNAIVSPKTSTKLSVQDFFSYTGASYELENKIKQDMNDPDSYEHVETQHKIEGSQIYVTTKFRGKNAFGAKVINRARATLDKNDGHVISWNLID
jgi:hypothetical protein